MTRLSLLWSGYIHINISPKLFVLQGEIQVLQNNMSDDIDGPKEYVDECTESRDTSGDNGPPSDTREQFASNRRSILKSTGMLGVSSVVFGGTGAAVTDTAETEQADDIVLTKRTEFRAVTRQLRREGYANRIENEPAGSLDIEEGRLHHVSARSTADDRNLDLRVLESGNRWTVTAAVFDDGFSPEAMVLSNTAVESVLEEGALYWTASLDADPSRVELSAEVFPDDYPRNSPPSIPGSRHVATVNSADICIFAGATCFALFLIPGTQLGGVVCGGVVGGGCTLKSAIERYTSCQGFYDVWFYQPRWWNPLRQPIALPDLSTC